MSRHRKVRLLGWINHGNVLSLFYIFAVASFTFCFSGKICLKIKRTIGPA